MRLPARIPDPRSTISARRPERQSPTLGIRPRQQGHEHDRPSLRSIHSSAWRSTTIRSCRSCDRPERPIVPRPDRAARATAPARRRGRVTGSRATGASGAQLRHQRGPRRSPEPSRTSARGGGRSSACRSIVVTGSRALRAPPRVSGPCAISRTRSPARPSGARSCGDDVRLADRLAARDREGLVGVGAPAASPARTGRAVPREEPPARARRGSASPELRCDHPRALVTRSRGAVG